MNILRIAAAAALGLAACAAAAGSFPTLAGRPAPADPEAVRALAEAHAARAHWPDPFPGFSADATLEADGKRLTGTLTVDPKFNVACRLGDAGAEKLIQPSVASLVMHRQPGPAPEYAASWKDRAPHPLGPAIDLNDSMGSWYRVRDHQILEVNRTMGGQRFTNVVLENEPTSVGFLPRAWTVAYYDSGSGALQRVSTTRVSWGWVEHVFVPRQMEVVTSDSGGTRVWKLVLSAHHLGP